MQELTDANEKCIKHVHYFDRQFLTVDEFNVEQNYHLGKRQRHNLMLHSAGIVKAFESTLDIKDKKLTVKICKGYAIDGLGREILIPDDSYVKGEYNFTDLNDINDLFVFILYDEHCSDSYLYEDMEDNKEEEKDCRKPRIAEIPKIEFSMYKDGGDLPKEEEKGRLLIGRLYKKDNGEYDLDKSEIKWADLHVAGDLNVEKGISAESISSSSADFRNNVHIAGDLTIDKSISAESISWNNADFNSNVHIAGDLTIGKSISANSITANSITADYIARKYIDKPSKFNIGDVVVSKYIPIRHPTIAITLLKEEIDTTNILADECVCGVVVEVEQVNEGETAYYIAYGGVCKVNIDDDTKKEINFGDLLVTSKSPGYATKFTYEKYSKERYASEKGIEIEKLKFENLEVIKFLNDLCLKPHGAILGKALSYKTYPDGTIPVLLMLK